MICSEILCESVNLGGKCWFNKCNECMNVRKFEKSFLGDKNVSWNEWRKNLKSGKLEMCINQGKKNELRKNLFKSYAFQCHVRVKRLQVRVFEYEMKDKSLSVLHFDLALAFSAEYWNEVVSSLVQGIC